MALSLQHQKANRCRLDRKGKKKPLTARESRAIDKLKGYASLCQGPCGGDAIAVLMTLLEVFDSDSDVNDSEIKKGDPVQVQKDGKKLSGEVHSIVRKGGDKDGEPKKYRVKVQGSGKTFEEFDPEDVKAQ